MSRVVWHMTMSLDGFIAGPLRFRVKPPHP